MGWPDWTKNTVYRRSACTHSVKIYQLDHDGIEGEELEPHHHHHALLDLIQLAYKRISESEEETTIIMMITL